MAEQSYELMHKDDTVASLQLDDLSGAILKVTPGTNPELLPLGGSQGADSLRKWWLRRAVPISQGNVAALLQQEDIPSTQSLLVQNLGLSLSDHYWIKPNGSELTWKDVSPWRTCQTEQGRLLSEVPGVTAYPCAVPDTASPDRSDRGYWAQIRNSRCCPQTP